MTCRDIISGVLDSGLRVLYLNRSIGALEKSAAKGLHLREFIREENYSFVSAAFDQARKTGGIAELNYSFPDPRGHLSVRVEVAWEDERYIVSGYSFLA